MSTLTRLALAVAAIGVAVVTVVVAGSERIVLEVHDRGSLDDVVEVATGSNGQTKVVRAVDDTLYAAVSAPYHGTEAVVVAHSFNDGKTWVAEARLSRAGVRAGLGSVVASEDGSIHVVWVDSETVGHVWYARRSGGSWTDGVKISPGPHYAGFPVIGDVGGQIHVAWYAAPPDEARRHGARYEIHHTMALGDGWAEPLLVSTTSPDSLNPSMAMDASGRLHLAWYQLFQERYRIAHSVWDGAKWSIPTVVSDAGHSTIGVALAASVDGSIHAVWQQTDGVGRGVFWSMWRAGSWSPPERIAAEGAHDPVIAEAMGAGMVASWSTDGVVHASLRGDGGWGPPVKVGTGGYPTLLGGNEVLAAWTMPEGGRHVIAVASLHGVAISTVSMPAVAIVIGLALVVAVASLSLGSPAWRRTRSGRAAGGRP